MQKTCTALVKGNGGNECRKPVVEDAEISLCALHLLLAAQEAEDLGKPYLIHLAQKEATDAH